VLDALLLENEFACAPATRLCDPPPCAELPDGCEARAVCRAGRCAVVESGCGVRVGD
jgi:hypothetical protein